MRFYFLQNVTSSFSICFTYIICIHSYYIIKQLFVLILFVFYSSSLLSQNQYDLLGFNAISSIDILYSQYKIKHKRHFNTVGVQITIPVCPANKFNCNLSCTVINYKQILPKNEIFNDSLISITTGFRSSIFKGVSYINKKENIQLTFLFGTEFGRLRLYNNPLLRKKNGYFAPKIELQPKIKLKQLIIGGTIGYGYDISNPNWKDTWFSKDKSYTLNKLKQSGFSWQVFLGWAI